MLLEQVVETEKLLHCGEAGSASPYDILAPCPQRRLCFRLQPQQGGRTLDSQQNKVSWRKGALCVARIPCAPVALFAYSESSAQRRTTSQLTNGETADTISVRAATRTSLQTNTAPFRRLRCVAPCTGNVPKTSKVRSSCEHVHC